MITIKDHQQIIDEVLKSECPTSRQKRIYKLAQGAMLMHHASLYNEHHLLKSLAICRAKIADNEESLRVCVQCRNKDGAALAQNEISKYKKMRSALCYFLEVQE